MPPSQASVPEDILFDVLLFDVLLYYSFIYSYWVTVFLRFTINNLVGFIIF